MTNEQRMQLLRFIADTIFMSKAQNTDITKIALATNTGRWPGRMFNGDLRGYDFSLNLGDRIINLRCLEQNPNKIDNFGNLKKYAILARQGHKIMWVIETKNNKFLGRLQDNVWYASFVPATTPATDYYNSPEHMAREDAAYAHIEKDINDPNFHGIPGTSGTPMANLPIEMAMPQNLPGYQNPAPSQIEPLEIDELPEIPDGITIPDYVYDQIADMDEPPDWDEYDG